MNRADSSKTEQNDAGTSAQSGTHLTQPRSGTVRYELIDKWGTKRGPFNTAERAAAYAKVNWPDQEQDPDETGKGWNVRCADCGE
jgi:hypothetical protein